MDDSRSSKVPERAPLGVADDIPVDILDGYLCRGIDDDIPTSMRIELNSEVNEMIFMELFRSSNTLVGSIRTTYTNS